MFKINHFSENYFLHGSEAGKYAFVSPLLREKGKRWFYPHFGFAYKAINANVRVILVSDIGGSNTQTVELNEMSNDLNTNWQYFFKNLTEVTFLSDAWNDATEPELFWQIVLLFDVCSGGSVSIDNIGWSYFLIFLTSSHILLLTYNMTLMISISLEILSESLTKTFQALVLLMRYSFLDLLLLLTEYQAVFGWE